MKRLALTSLFTSSILLAGMGMNMPSFNDFDTNNDAKVTKAEFEKAQQTRMTKQAEAGKMMRNAGNAPVFSDVDSNGNGYIDKNEFQTHQQKRLRMMRQSKN